MIACWWCDEQIRRGPAVAPDNDTRSLMHGRCWAPWVRAQGFRRGRRPARVTIPADQWPTEGINR